MLFRLHLPRPSTKHNSAHVRIRHRSSHPKQSTYFLAATSLNPSPHHHHVLPVPKFAMATPKPNETLVVAVTGAAGQISYSLLPLLVGGHVFGPQQMVQLRLLEIPQALPALSGVTMELIDGAYPLLDSVIETSDARTAFKGADVAILVGAFPRKQGMERKDLLTRNLPIFKGQGEALSQVASRDVKVLVVGNPANTNAMVLNRFAPNVSSRNITALTRLDHNRACAQVALRVGVRVDDVDDVAIWGNHSSTQYPDIVRATAAGVPVLSKLGGLEAVAEEFIPLIQKRGAAVIKARGFSSAMSAANAIADHMRSWICGDDKIVSMAVAADGSYGIPKGIYYSFPVRCLGRGEYEIVQGIDVDHFSQRYMDATKDELLAERDDALALLA